MRTRLAVVCVFLGACGSKPTFNNDPTGVDATGAAKLSIDPTSFDFSTTSSTTFTIKNDGDADADPVALQIVGDGSQSFVLRNPACGTLPPGATCTADVAFVPRDANQAVAQLQAMDFTAGDASAGTADLTGTGIPLQALTVTGTAPGTPIGGSSNFTVTVTNQTASASGTLQITSIAAEFAVVDDSTSNSNTCLNKSIPAFVGSCTVHMTFTPQGGSSNPRMGTVKATGTMESGVGQVTGTIVALLIVDHTSGQSMSTNQCAAPPDKVSFTFTNQTSQALTSLTASLMPGSSLVLDRSACPQMLAANTACTMTISIGSNTAPGTSQTQLLVTGMQGAAASTFMLNVGVAVAACDMTVTPNPLVFTSIAAGTTTTATFQVVNTNPSASVTHTVTGAVVGSNTPDFSITTDNCTGMTLAGNGGMCPITVTFHASGAKTSTGTIGVSVAGRQPLTENLSGVGLASTLTMMPSDSYAFTQPVAPTQLSDQVMFTIKSTVPTGPMTVSMTGPYVLGPNMCAAGLAGGGSCTVSVTFAPTMPGSTNPGSITATAASGTVTTLLTGSSPAMVITPNPQAIRSGGAGVFGSPFVFTVTNYSAAPTGAITLSTVGDFPDSFVLNSTGCTGKVLAAQTNPTANNCTFTVAYSAPGGSTLPAQVTATASPGGTTPPLMITGDPGP